MIHLYNWSEIHNTILAWNFSKKVTKERLELKTSYLIRKLLTKWSSKTYCNVQKEDWGCCCCWWRPWRACSKKTLFTQEKIFSSRWQQGLDLDYLTQKMHLFLSVSDLPRLHRVRGKEHMQIKKSSNLEKK